VAAAATTPADSANQTWSVTASTAAAGKVSRCRGRAPRRPPR
jgi:hypothetical protein